MTRPRLGTAAALLSLAAGLLHADTPAPDAATPSLMERLSVHLDFEQDVDHNNFPDEIDVTPVVGRRHPQNVRDRLDETERYAGQRSFLMELDGVANVYETRQDQTYRFDPRFSYRLTGHIKTTDVPATGLRATAAKIELVGIASDRKTIVFSTRTAGVTGTSDWTRVSLDVPRDVTRTFRLVRIRCIIDGVALGGRVWFDEITLTPRPGIAVSAGKPEGFFSPGDVPRAVVSLDTLIETDCRLSVKLTDPAGGNVLDRTLDVKPRLGFVADVEIPLPIVGFGPYRLDLGLTAEGRPVSSLTRTFLHWPGTSGEPVSPDFGVYVGGLDALDDHGTAMLLESRLGTICLDLFRGADGPDNVTTLAARAVSHLGELRQDRIEPVVVLGTVPGALVDSLFREKQVVNVDEATWLRTLSLDGKYWSGMLAQVPSALVARTVYWQIGRRIDHNVSPQDLARAVSNLRETLKSLTYRLKVGVVFDGTETDEMVRAAGVCDFIVLDCGDRVDACRELPARITRLRALVGEVWVSLDVSSADWTALVEQVVLARAGGADRVNFRLGERGLVGPTGDPHPMTAAAATLVRELGGKQCAGMLATNMPTCLFVGSTGSRLVVVPKPDAAGDVLYLGTPLRQIDLDGNVSPLPTAGPRALLANRGRPFLVDGLDVEALLTRLSLRVAAGATPGPELRTDLRPQDLHIELLGGFRQPVVGTLEVLAPDGWQVERPRQALRLDPAASTVLSTRVELPVTEVPGDHVLAFKLDLDGRQMVVRRRVRLTPRTIDTVVSTRRLPDGTWCITQKVTNRGEQEARLALFMVSGETGRQERYVNGLAPGASAEVPFTLDRTESAEVWTGWRETAGPGFFNRYFPLVRAPEQPVAPGLPPRSPSR